MKKNVNLNKLMNKIGYVFKNQKLLIQALTHSSYANEHNLQSQKDNEKLEFLGDSVLDLISTEYIVKKFKGLNEGDLSKIKSQIISEVAFSSISNELDLGEYLFLSNGENATGGRHRKSILGDAFEALIGAIFLDSDYYQTKKIALRYIENVIIHLDKIEGISDYKTELQEFVQPIYKTTPKYELIDSFGPDHNKSFKVRVLIGDKIMGEGFAKSKKDAEKMAAKEALIKLGSKK